MTLWEPRDQLSFTTQTCMGYPVPSVRSPDTGSAYGKFCPRAAAIRPRLKNAALAYRRPACPIPLGPPGGPAPQPGPAGYPLRLSLQMWQPVAFAEK